MKIALITGANGLVGSESCRFFAEKGFKIIGIDNDMRSYFFGKEASTSKQKYELESVIEDYEQYDIDIRDIDSLKSIFEKYSTDIEIVIHTAAQPSHDWASKEPLTDFTINANGTLNLLEMTRQYCREAVFIFTSTNKVYGDLPNSLPLIELDKRWEIDNSSDYYYSWDGINEKMSIDNSKHSLFGVSKVAADVMVQEYGKYFNMKTGIFRGGCLTGPNHSGAELHGFLSYLVKCAIDGSHYNVFGYGGKQVRDNIHSYDLINAFYHFYKSPKNGEVYNIGGSRNSNISMLEAIDMIKDVSGHKLDYSLLEDNRIGDHIWYVSDVSKFKNDYPNWSYKYDINMILTDIITVNENKLRTNV